jgi:penicillin-binding protein 1A
VGDTFWTPANFDEKFLGPITLRTALEKSRNLVSADIVSRIGIDAPIQYARLMGITSPLGRNLSLSLGSGEVSPLEMTRAYGVFAARGLMFDSVFVTKITDRFGTVLFDYSAEKPLRAKQAINENSAFVMANMMKGVIDHGTGYKVKELGRPVAGKTGTSNDPKETGGVVSAPIWLNFMRDFLTYERDREERTLEQNAREEASKLGIEYVKPSVVEQLDFPVPDGVEPFWISKESGARSSEGAPGAFLEYFVKGTEPEERVYEPADEESDEGEESSSSYLESPDL